MNDKIRVRGQLRVYMQWPIILSVLLIVMNVLVGTVSIRAGAITALFTVVYILIALWLYLYKRKKLLKGLVEFSAEYAWIQKQLLTDMQIPYGIADENGHLLWMNKAFLSVLNSEKIPGRDLCNLFEGVDRSMLDTKDSQICVHTRYGDSMYRVDLKKVFLDESTAVKETLGPEAGEQSLFAVYLQDETDMIKYKQQIDDQKMVCGLIYLDNYDEALDSVEEVRRSLLMALIDRKINKYITSMNGIVKKMEKDKYFFAIKQQYIATLKENRFSLLEEVKTVNIGNEMAVTLSIGIGMNGESYCQNYDYSRAAIDMALGRGGDQAVVKDSDKIQYYGGKAPQVEKATRVKARVKAHALKELIDTKEQLLIMGHKIGDIDSFGAAIGIYRIAVSLNKKAHIIINDVTTSVRPMMDRFLNNPEYPEDMFLTTNQASEHADANTVLVVVDVNRPSFTEAPELLRMIKTIVVLDHHRQSSEIIDNAVLSYVEPYASSSCEMVAEILQYISDGIKIRPAEADAMYAGVVIDTNNFMNQTGVRTFEAAAFLRRNGADVTRVRKLFRDKMVDYKARAEAIRGSEVFEGSFAISICPSEGIESPTIVGAQAANELLDIVGIKASIVLTPYNGIIYLSARSIDEVNVQVMMEHLGGGGHRTIAGAQLPGATVDEAVLRVKEVIKEMLEKGDIS